MAKLSELQEDILKVAVRHPDMTDEAIAGIVGCNEDWVAKTRRQHESEISEADLPDEWQTVDDPFAGPDSESDDGGSSSSSSSDRSLLGVLIVAPIKLTLWMFAVMFKLTVWMFTLPLRLLGAGSGDN